MWEFLSRMFPLSCAPQCTLRPPGARWSADSADSPPRSKETLSRWWPAWRCRCACCRPGRRTTPCPCRSPAAPWSSAGSSSGWASLKERCPRSTSCGKSTRTGSRSSAPRRLSPSSGRTLWPRRRPRPCSLPRWRPRSACPKWSSRCPARRCRGRTSRGCRAASVSPRCHARWRGRLTGRATGRPCWGPESPGLKKTWQTVRCLQQNNLSSSQNEVLAVYHPANPRIHLNLNVWSEYITLLHRTLITCIWDDFDGVRRGWCGKSRLGSCKARDHCSRL